MPGVDQVAERPFEELGQSVTQQAMVLAREQADIARRELTARARQAGPGAAMVGGGALLAALASGTGTAALILLLARRRGASAAALGVTGAYAGAGALLAREGLARVRQAGLPPSDVPVQDEAVRKAKPDPGPAKRRATSAAKSARSTTSAAKSPRSTKPAAKSARSTKPAATSNVQRTGRPKPKSPQARTRASRPSPDRMRRPAQR